MEDGMKVENPRFVGVWCSDCPWGDEEGASIDGKCGYRHCPTNMEEYAEACRIAEEANTAGGTA